MMGQCWQWGQAGLTGTMSSCWCSLPEARERPGTSPERCAARVLDLGGLKGGLHTSAGPRCCGRDGGFAKAAHRGLRAQVSGGCHEHPGLPTPAKE